MARYAITVLSAFPYVLVVLAVYISGLLIMWKAKKSSTDYPNSTTAFYLLAFSLAYFFTLDLYFRAIAP
jgi:hypothetical protein